MANAQKVYSHLLTDGWHATKIFDYGDDTCIIIGLEADSVSYKNLSFQYIDSENNVTKRKKLNLGFHSVSYEAAYSVRSVMNKIYIQGYADLSTDSSMDLSAVSKRIKF